MTGPHSKTIHKILLINPTVDSLKQRDGWAKGSSMQPHGLCQLSTFLQMHGYEVRIIDMVVDAFRPEEIRAILLEYAPEMVGISAFTPCFKMALSVSRFVKKINPEIVIVLGGPHVTLMPKEALAEAPAVDYIVAGEGEATLIELLEAIQYPGALPLSDILGLVYRATSEQGITIQVNPARERLTGLDVLAFSDRDGVPLEKYVAAYTLISSRGCPGECIFCAAGAISGTQQRSRSVENLFCEVYYLYVLYQPSFLLITDDTFTVSHRRVRRFCDLMLNAEIHMGWWCESRVQAMTPDLLQRMATAGCVSIQFGVESGSQTVLRGIRKGMSLERLHQVLATASGLGIQPICSFILGHYCDTPETMQQTIDLMRTLREKYGAVTLVSFNTPFPGTYQYEEREKLGLHLYSHDWNDFDLGNLNIYANGFDRNVLAHYYFEAQAYVAQREEVDEIFKKRQWQTSIAAEQEGMPSIS